MGKFKKLSTPYALWNQYLESYKGKDLDVNIEEKELYHLGQL
jgi:hypothetical protein